jgi:hypothetical protein
MQRRPSSNPTLSTAAAGILDLSFFGEPPLIGGEDLAAYKSLLLQVTSTLNPVDIFEHIWVRDITNLQWEIQRLRRIKAEIISLNMEPTIDTYMSAACSNPDDEADPPAPLPYSPDLLKRWRKHDPDAVAEVKAMLIGQEFLTARVFAIHALTYERIDNMVLTMEARRNLALKECERHRATFGKALRQAVKQIEAHEPETPSEQQKAA